MNATKKAFDKFRSQYGPARLPPAAAIANSDELVCMTKADGLTEWKDCSSQKNIKPDQNIAPSISGELIKKTNLWVVAEKEVLHAEEHCYFGKNLQTGVIKHTNLTGGSAAYCGGEMIILDDLTIVINGKSRRYGPRSSKEMWDVAKSFTESGYFVWAMGYDDDTGLALPFQGTRPKWIE